MKYFRELIKKIVPKLWWGRASVALLDFDKTPPVLIYQMGKVGSSAVYESIIRTDIANPVYHVHFLSYSNLNAVEQYQRDSGALNAIGKIHYWRSLRRKLDRTEKTVYLISLVRDPVAREISNIFENMASHHKELMTDTGDVNIEKTVAFLKTLFADFNEATDYTCTWFDKEILDTFGIDVYATPFDHSRAYSIIANDRAKLLLLRMEDLSVVFSEAMREFMGISVPIVRANDSSTGQHHEAYKAVIGKIALSQAEAENIYSSRYALHFYPDDVRNEFLKKWTSTSQFANAS